MIDEYTKKYLKKTIKFAKIFRYMPFIRAILLNGSVATGNVKKTSDIDLLIITKNNRLYTARFFLLIVGFLTGQKRTKEENRSHAGKFCFNYFLADNYLEIPTGRGDKMDRYCAMNYSKSVLVWGNDKLFNKFFEINRELFVKYNCDVKTKPFVMKDIAMVRNGNNLVKKTFESILEGKIGDCLEQKLKHFQIKMIEKDPRTKKYPDFVVYNDREARFHPPK